MKQKVEVTHKVLDLWKKLFYSSFILLKLFSFFYCPINYNMFFEKIHAFFEFEETCEYFEIISLRNAYHFLCGQNKTNYAVVYFKSSKSKYVCPFRFLNENWKGWENLVQDIYICILYCPLVLLICKQFFHIPPIWTSTYFEQNFMKRWTIYWKPFHSIWEIYLIPKTVYFNSKIRGYWYSSEEREVWDWNWFWNYLFNIVKLTSVGFQKPAVLR